MTRIAADDERLIWSGAISLERGDGWVKPWRIPYGDVDLFSPAGSELGGRAEMPSGVRLRFGTDARALRFEMEPMADAGKCDLYVDGSPAGQAEVAAGQTAVAFEGLGAGEKTVELWLPQYVPFALRGIEVADGSKVWKQEDGRPRWVVYGSSITHCRAAASPSYTWPGIVARTRGLNLTSLGFGGQCHADPMVARLMRDRPADLLTVKIGINIYGRGSMNIRTFRPAIIGTIATIRDGHPDAPFVVCSPIWGAHRETTANDVGMTLPMMREEIREAVESFRRRGDDQLYYVDGLRLFDESLAQHLPDDLHPSAEGYRLLAANFLHEVFEVQGVEVGGGAEVAGTAR